MMCEICGHDIPNGSKSCPNCGVPVEASAVAASAVAASAVAAPAVAAPAVAASPVEESAVEELAVVTYEDTAPISYTDSFAPETDEFAESAPGKKNRKHLLIIGIALLVVVLGAAAFFASRNLGQPKVEGDRFSYTDSPLIITGEETTLIYSGSNMPVTIHGCYASSQFSMDLKKCVIMVNQDDEGKGILYYYDGSKAKKLSDDVSVYRISADGNGVGYITQLMDGNRGILNLYDASEDKSGIVSNCAAPDMILSPDGKLIAYRSDLHLGVNGTTMYGSIAHIGSFGDSGCELESNAIVIGLSNNMEYVYYLKLSRDPVNEASPLFVYHDGTSEELGSVYINSPFIFNQDLSEILYVNDQMKTYLSRAGGGKQKAADTFLYSMYVPQNSQKFRLWSGENDINIMFNVKKLAGQAYWYGDSNDLLVGYLNRRLSFSETSGLSGLLDLQTQWTADGKGLYYPDDAGRIQYLEDVSDPDLKPVEVERDHFAESFVVTPDQSTVYLVDQAGTLWMKKGDSAAVAVAEKVLDHSLILASDDQGLYFIADSARDKETNNESGTLSYLSGSPDAKVSKIADDVAYVTVSEAGTAYYVFSEKDQDKDLYEVFYSADGRNFASVMDDAFIP